MLNYSADVISKFKDLLQKLSNREVLIEMFHSII